MSTAEVEAQLRSLPSPPPPAPSRSRTKRLYVEINISEARARNEDSDAEEESAPKRTKVHHLSDDLLALVEDRLFESRKYDPSSFRYSVPEVLEFFTIHHPDKIAPFLSIRTLYKWREDFVSPKATVANKPGAPFVLSISDRLACGRLLKEMGEAGSPMNTKIARPILIGYLQSHKLVHLYSSTPAKGKISFSKSWILALFDEFDLADRAGTTDKQKLPEVSFFLHVMQPIYRLILLYHS
jgi:hypothetical protein